MVTRFDEFVRRLETDSIGKERKLGKFGPFTAYLVDAERIRDSSKTLQEFSDYGTHVTFPRDIPAGELWIDSKVGESERGFLVEEAVNIARLMDSGMSKSKAYDAAERINKAHREKADGVKPNDRTIPEGLRESELETVDGITVWIVDGHKVRDHFKTDFVEGGHGYVYPWIPKDEVWIDADVRPDERRFVLAHEMHEREDMKDTGMGYQKAHRRAAEYEFKLRRPHG